MPDAKALVRVLDEFLWTLRREGIPISTGQAMDTARAVRVVGLEHPTRVREAMASVVVLRRADRPRFDQAFDAFFARRNPELIGDLSARLRSRGFTPDEVAATEKLLARRAAPQDVSGRELALLLGRGADLNRVLFMSGGREAIELSSAMTIGFQTQKLLRALGTGRSRTRLARTRSELVEALGLRGESLAEALAQELELSEEFIRAYFQATLAGRAETLLVRDGQPRGLEATPFRSLGDNQREEIRRTVQRFAVRLRLRARLRIRVGRRGRVDARGLLRQCLRTGGAPFSIPRRHRRRSLPKLILLCDVSESVRESAAFMLEFAYAAQDLFERARTFVFISDLGETTALFKQRSPKEAIALAWLGAPTMRTSDNSNYGRVLRAFETQHARDLDRRTTVVILGDGRTNYHSPAADVLKRIRSRCRALLWLCPEPPSEWLHGDSAMPRYAPLCTAVHTIICVADLQRAALAMLGEAPR